MATKPVKGSKKGLGNHPYAKPATSPLGKGATTGKGKFPYKKTSK